MTLNEYQEKAMTTCLPSSQNDIYAINGLSTEVGEINDKIAKWIRKEYIMINNNTIVFNPEAFKKLRGINLADELMKEVGNVLWFVSLLSHQLGFTLDEIAQNNLDKLASRQQIEYILDITDSPTDWR